MTLLKYLITLHVFCSGLAYLFQIYRSFHHTMHHNFFCNFSEINYLTLILFLSSIFNFFIIFPMVTCFYCTLPENTHTQWTKTQNIFNQSHPLKLKLPTFRLVKVLPSSWGLLLDKLLTWLLTCLFICLLDHFPTWVTKLSCNGSALLSRLS